MEAFRPCLVSLALSALPWFCKVRAFSAWIPPTIGFSGLPNVKPIERSWAQLPAAGKSRGHVRHREACHRGCVTEAVFNQRIFRKNATFGQYCEVAPSPYSVITMPKSRAVLRWRFLRFPVLSLLALSATVHAHAQVSAYGIVGVNDFGFSSQGNANYYSDTAGVGGGVFYNFPIRSRVTVGLDGRVLYGPGTYGGTTADVALRIGFVPSVNRLRPFLAIGGGIVSAVINPHFDPVRYTNGALELLGGLDIRATDTIDIRAVELGAAAGGSTTGTASGVGFLDAGVVYHFRHGAKRN
jgi:hypothetical protein